MEGLSFLKKVILPYFLNYLFAYLIRIFRFMKKSMREKLECINTDLHSMKSLLRTYRFLFENYASTGISKDDEEDMKAIGYVLGREVKRVEDIQKRIEELAF